VESWAGDYKGVAARGFLAIIIKVSVVLFISGVLIGASGFISGWCDEPPKEADEQNSPKAILDKYEWFKDMSAQLDKRQSQIHVLYSRIRALSAFNKNSPVSMWKEEHKEQANGWVSEMAQIQASFNDSAAQYNSEMARFNWRFSDPGRLPQGAGKPLPREYKPIYITPSVTTFPPIR
jgi:hypothetical protein